MVLLLSRSARAACPDSDIASCDCVENMSTSVYNPFTFNEVSRIRAIARRPPVDAGALARVRRDLFGPVNHEDSRKFVMRELAAQQTLASGRWGFDFVREEPLKGENTRFFWEKVTVADQVPKAYDHGEYPITTSEIISAQEDADVSAAAPTPPASPLEAASSTCPSTSPQELSTAKPTVPSVKPAAQTKESSSQKSSLKRRRNDPNPQKKITDFLRIRKSSSIAGAKAAKYRRLEATKSRPATDHFNCVE